MVMWLNDVRRTLWTYVQKWGSDDFFIIPSDFVDVKEMVLRLLFFSFRPALGTATSPVAANSDPIAGAKI